MKVNTFMQDARQAEASTSAFHVNGESRVKMSEEEVTRWFKGENSHGIYAIYKARFRGSIYLGEEFWSLIGNDKWEPRKAVMEWFFVGNDNIWEITEEEAKNLLPPQAVN
jgi:hypothetical protein